MSIDTGLVPSRCFTPKVSLLLIRPVQKSFPNCLLNTLENSRLYKLECHLLIVAPHYQYKISLLPLFLFKFSNAVNTAYFSLSSLEKRRESFVRTAAFASISVS